MSRTIATELRMTTHMSRHYKRRKTNLWKLWGNGSSCGEHFPIPTSQDKKGALS